MSTSLPIHLMVRRHALVTLAASLGALVAGCASAPPVAERFTELPVGTVATFQRSASGSYGQVQGPVVWTYLETHWNGQRMLDARNSVGGGTYHDPATFAIVANLNAAGQVVMSYDPPIGPDWPLQVGKTWTSMHRITMHPSGQTQGYEARWSVEAYETLDVPAGRFATWRVLRVGSDGETETRWLSQQPGVPLVKRLMVRSAAHRLGEGRQEAELVAVQLPSR